MASAAKGVSEGEALSNLGKGAAKQAATSKRKEKRPPRPQGNPDVWKRTLGRRRNGDVLPTRANVCTIVRHEWPELLAWDDFNGVVLKKTATLADRLDRPTKALRKAGPWLEDDTVLLLQWLERSEYEVSPDPQVVRDAVRVEARRRAFHPIQDFLTKCEEAWQAAGRPRRLDDLLIRVAGADDSEYVRAVTSKWVISAVARAFDPGCKVDHVLILEGEGRSGKSSFFETLVGNPDWFTPTHVELGSKDAMQTIAKKWVVELAELDSLSRSEWSRVKAFLTTRVDTYRRAYGRDVEDQRRKVVFCGTVNPPCSYLQEPDMRFWPVWSASTVFDQVRLDLVDADRELIWGEATARYRNSEPWHIKDVDILAQAIREQEKRTLPDPWRQRIHAFLRQSSARQQGVTTLEILDDLGVKAAQAGRTEEMRVGRILKLEGWCKSRPGSKKTRGYRYYPRG